ncbi:glycosyltransferase [Roseburia sp. NSJ-9]|jgi:rhamnopyranosyl-N-acetylglucosaminyl-diphospho-decaprenol beta-1,3/1,4-galactofuranosyltransferase|uniref:Glycosyltransferase n=1 Tax=Roseburia lenta TaxID=2763061 RepID=A0ABR7GGR5_9FIRM|nr:glycosyltransferase [Roseburia lenta]MBC5686645.1 glycosyltransferase [Roseburia lenta]
MNNAVVIVTYNRVELLKECLACVCGQTIPFSRVIVVDNHSTDGTAEFLAAREDLDVIREPENLGGAGGFYDGLQCASQGEYDWVLIIDDDAMIAPDYMEKLLDYANAHTGIYGLAGKVVTEGHIDVSHRRRIINRLLYVESNVASEEYQKESFSCDAATFCGLLLQGQKMREIGLPQKGYFLWYDDIEYCLRLQECGGVTVVPAAVLHHKTVLSKEGMVTKGVLHRIGWRQYYGYRNRYDTAKRHLGSLSAWVILWQYRVFWLLSFFMTWKKETREQGRSNQKILHDVIKDCKAGKLGKHPEYHY